MAEIFTWKVEIPGHMIHKLLFIPCLALMELKMVHDDLSTINGVAELLQKDVFSYSGDNNYIDHTEAPGFSISVF